MGKIRLHRLLLVASLLILLFDLATAGVLAQKSDPAPVTVDGIEIFEVRERFGSRRPTLRAKDIGKKIEALIEDESFDASNIKVIESESHSQIKAGDQVIMTVTDADALAFDKERQVLAQELMRTIRTSLENRIAKRNLDQVIERVHWRNFGTNLLHILSDPLSLKFVTAGLGMLIIMTIAYSVRRSISSYLTDSNQRYTISKVIEVISYFIGLVFVTVVFRDTLGNLAVILGAATAGIAFALKELIVSLAGWVAVSFGDFYKVGDRVQVGTIKGDVIDIGFVRSTLMELGEWVQGDLYTGRIVRIANSVVFSGPIFNYSRDLPFIWDEIVIQLSLDSSIDSAQSLFERVTSEIVGDYVEEAKSHWSKMKNKYLVEDESLDPMITLRVLTGALELTIRYPVDMKERRITKDRLFRKILEEIQDSADTIKLK